MKLYIKKVGGKFCTHFKFGEQTFRLSGFDTMEEAEWQEQQLKVCFSNYGMLISKNIKKELFNEAFKSLNEIIEKITNEESKCTKN